MTPSTSARPGPTCPAGRGTGKCLRPVWCADTGMEATRAGRQQEQGHLHKLGAGQGKLGRIGVTAIYCIRLLQNICKTILVKKKKKQLCSPSWLATPVLRGESVHEGGQGRSQSVCGDWKAKPTSALMVSPAGFTIHPLTVFQLKQRQRDSWKEAGRS